MNPLNVFTWTPWKRTNKSYLGRMVFQFWNMKLQCRPSSCNIPEVLNSSLIVGTFINLRCGTDMGMVFSCNRKGKTPMEKITIRVRDSAFYIWFYDELNILEIQNFARTQKKKILTRREIFKILSSEKKDFLLVITYLLVQDI